VIDNVLFGLTCVLFAVACYAFYLDKFYPERTISKRIARHASPYARGLIIGFVVGLVVGLLLGHWFWPVHLV